MFLGDFEGDFGEFDEVAVGEGEAAEGVAAAGVESGGEDDEVGAEGVHGGDEFLAEGIQNGSAASSGGEGAVEGGGFAGGGAGFGGVASAWVPRGLVDGEEEDVGVFVEDVLGAVAVVDIPIGDEDAVDAPGFAGVAGGDSGVVVDAEAHAAGGGGVVAGRADGGEGVADMALEDGIDGGEGGAGGEAGDFWGFRANVGVAGGEGSGVAGGIVGDGIEVGAGVDEVDVFVEREAGGEAGKGVEEARLFEGFGEGEIALLRLGVAGTGVVAAEGVIKDEAGGVRRNCHGWYCRTHVTSGIQGTEVQCDP